MRKKLIPKKYEENPYIKIALWLLFLLYVGYFFGYRISTELLTGDYKTVSDNRAGYQLEISPYWRMYKSSTPGIRNIDQAVLVLNDGIFLWRDSIFIVSKKKTVEPSWITAVQWSNHQTKYDANDDIGIFKEFDLNNRKAFVAQGWYQERFEVMAVILGEESEFVIHFSTEDTQNLDTFYDMLNTFQIKDGF